MRWEKKVVDQDEIREIAERLIDGGHYELLGSDCHNQIQMNVVKEAFKNKYFKKAMELPLLNRSLFR